MSLPVSVSFSTIAAAQLLEAFDARFVPVGVSSLNGHAGGGSVAANNITADSLYYFDGGEVFADDQFVEWTSTGAGTGFVGGAIRMSPGGNAYAGIDNGTTLFFNRYAGGSFNGTIGTIASAAAGTLVRIQMVGTGFECFYDGVSVFTATDASIASGQAGLAGFHIDNTGLGITSWTAGNVGATVINPMSGLRGQPLT